MSSLGHNELSGCIYFMSLEQTPNSILNGFFDIIFALSVELTTQSANRPREDQCKRTQACVFYHTPYGDINLGQH